MRQFLQGLMFRARIAWHESDLRGIEVLMARLEVERAARIARIGELRLRVIGAKDVGLLIVLNSLPAGRRVLAALTPGQS